MHSVAAGDAESFATLMREGQARTPTS